MTPVLIFVTQTNSILYDSNQFTYDLIVLVHFIRADLVSTTPTNG